MEFALVIKSAVGRVEMPIPSHVGISVLDGGAQGSPSARAIELWGEGMTYQRIATTLGVSYQTVYGWINTYKRRMVPDCC